MSETIKDIIGNSTIKVLVVAFILGGIYFEFKSMQRDLIIVEQRLDKKIKVLNNLELRVRDLETCN